LALPGGTGSSTNGRQDVQKKKIGFIGAGNMGEALVKGLLSAGMIGPRSVLISDPSRKRAADLVRAYGVKKVSGNAALVSGADIVVLAVKPEKVNSVLKEVGAVLDRSKLLISVAAGVSLFQIESRLKTPVRLVRAMPNTPALVGEGATAVCYGHTVTAADRKLVMRVFGSVGRAVELEESLMDAVTGLSGSGPAYVFSLIQGMADGGVREGLPRATALELAAQTVLGSARMVLETGKHPLQLRDQVASPGGTTIQGIGVLQETGFEGMVMEAVRAATERSRQLSEQ
jgi:pyrroline-5-carboxylate reductase